MFNPLSRYNNQESPKWWLLPMLVLLLILYWLFVHYLERIDLDLTLRQWWQVRFPLLPLPGIFVFAIEMVHPRVLRHLIPPLVGWWLAYRAAVNLVQALYDLPDEQAASRLLSRLQSPRAADRPIPISGQTLAADREKSLLLRVGGPGRVVIGNGEVAVTELNGRFYRLLPSGGHLLSRFETIHAVLDLQQQERMAENVPLITRDGIEITCDVSVTFRISTGGEPPTRAKPYPFDPDAVRTAAYAETVTTGNEVVTWESIPLNTAKGELSKIVARYRLDELLYPRNTAREPFLTIKNELQRRVRASLINAGIELTDIWIGRLELPKQVTDQYIKYWQTHLETQIRLSQADGEAIALEEIEIARAEAEMTMIQAIIEGVRRAQRTSSTSTMREIVALRLIEALEKMAQQSQQIHPLPAKLLPQLHDIRRQLAPGTVSENQGTDES